MNKWITVLALFWCAILPASAHKPSDSYLTLRLEGQELSGQWDVSLRDLDLVLALDANHDSQLTWDEVRGRHDEIAAYALSRLELQADGAPCRLAATRQLIDRHTDGAYTIMQLRGSCAGAGATPRHLSIRYSLFAGIDANHRGLLQLTHDGATETAVLGGDQPLMQLDLGRPSRWTQFADYVRHGVWHIWIGFDHILFLISLLLPAVLVWRDRQWLEAQNFADAALDVLKIVSAFTLAHSITLSLAALQVMSLPSRWVESAIAASVAVAALNNIVPVVRGKRWLAAFVFGLVHGFGFASVLADLGLPRDALALALVGFNVGVEIGQIAIVAAFLPLAYAVRGTWLYRRVMLVGGSGAIALLAALWFGERAFDLII